MAEVVEPPRGRVCHGADATASLFRPYLGMSKKIHKFVPLFFFQDALFTELPRRGLLGNRKGQDSLPWPFRVQHPTPLANACYLADQDEDGSTGCLGVPYTRGSTSASSSTCG